MGKWFSRFATHAARLAGKPYSFFTAVALVILWAALGPVFGYSNGWQLTINTGTTIVTFLMVFLIQSTQNRDGAALQAKLDELIKSSKADNRFVGLDHLSDEEIEGLRRECEERART